VHEWQGLVHAARQATWAASAYGITAVRVALRGTGGAPIAPATRVGLAIFRRIGNPGTASAVLGRRIGAKSSGTAGSVSIQLPRKVPAADLWVVATTNAGRALIPLRP